MDTALVFVFYHAWLATPIATTSVYTKTSTDSSKNPTVPKLGDFPGPSKAGVLCDMVQGPQGGRKESTVVGISSPNN